MSRRLVLAVACAAGFSAMAGVASATEWPTRAVTVVVPFPPGGNTDTMARLASEFLTKSLGQPFVVENRPTGGGVVGAGQIARAPADGYTLFFASAGQMIIIPLRQTVPYDPEKDFRPVSVFGTGAFMLGVRNELPANSVEELVKLAKSRKDPITVASPGPGTIGHLSATLFSRRAGIDITFVPYRGGGPAMAGFLAGDVDMYFGNASELLQHRAGGRIKILAASTAEPVAAAPDIPPVASVYPGFSTSSWNGFLVASATPQAIVDKLAAAVREAVNDKAISDRLTSLGIRPGGNTPAEFQAILDADRKLYAEALKEAGAKN